MCCDERGPQRRGRPVIRPTEPRTVTRRSRVAIVIIAALAFGIIAAIMFGNDIAIALESSAASRSIGTKAGGRLEHGKRLPTSGPNFRAYSRLGALLGRNSVHGDVRATILDAYAELARASDITWIYGETGWPSGGRFPPHRSHQNGLSVDFMVPVRSTNGDVALLPTAPWRTFGYAIEFDSAGRSEDLRIDFPAIALHLEALDRSARRHGLAIELVIFAPELRRRLVATDAGRRLERRMPWMTGTPWVRHDEHYHVDFRVEGRRP